MDILTIIFIAGALILGIVAGFLIAGSKLNASATKEKEKGDPVFLREWLRIHIERKAPLRE